MTNITWIKVVMRSDREKVNKIFIYELQPNMAKADSRTGCIYGIEPIICRTDTRAKNCVKTSNRKSKNTYGTAAAAVALDLGSVSSPAMSSRRLSTSGKKLSSGK